MNEKLKADINAARQTICSAISDWTQTEYSYGDPIPTMVNGKLAGRLKRSLLTQFEPIEKIVRPAMLAMPPNNEELKSLKELIKRSELTIRVMEHLSDTVRQRWQKADNSTNLAPSETTMQEQIIAAIGTIQAADIALKRLCDAANEVIYESQPELIKSRVDPKIKSLTQSPMNLRVFITT